MPVLSAQDMFYTRFEPIQKNRFRVTIDGLPSFIVKSITIPMPSSSVVTIDHINTQFKVKGKTTYGSWSMSLYNAINPSSLETIVEWFRLSHEEYGRDGYSDFYIKNITVEILDPVGAVVNLIVIKDAFVTKINDLNFDKSGEGLVDIEVTGECSMTIVER